MIRFGAHAFVWIGEWTTDSGNRAIEQAAEAGFDFIEIPLLNPAAFDVKSHRDALTATCLWRPPNQPSEVLARDGLAFLRSHAAKHGLS
jgi:hypothetical protein